MKQEKEKYAMKITMLMHKISISNKVLFIQMITVELAFSPMDPEFNHLQLTRKLDYLLLMKLDLVTLLAGKDLVLLLVTPLPV